jgi:hypothetical protein
MDLEIQSEGLDEMLSLVFLAFDDQFAQDTTLRAYRNTPNLVGMNQRLFPAGQVLTPEIDVLSNARRLLRVSKSGVMPDPEGLVSAGIWDTQVESLLPRLARHPDIDAEAVASGLSVLSADALIETGNASSISRALLRDIGEGFTVIAATPLDLDSVAPEQRWWRIDPSTGNALGMTQYGGASVTELSILLVGLAIIAGYMTGEILNALDCENNPPNAALAAIPQEDRMRYCMRCESTSMALVYYAVAAIGALDPDRSYEQAVDDLYRACYR